MGERLRRGPPTGGLRLLPCTQQNLPMQRWWLWHDSRYGTHAFVNESTGRCLDESWSIGLQAIRCDGLRNQEWHIGTPPDRNGLPAKQAHGSPGRIVAGAVRTPIPWLRSPSSSGTRVPFSSFFVSARTASPCVA